MKCDKCNRDAEYRFTSESDNIVCRECAKEAVFSIITEGVFAEFETNIRKDKEGLIVIHWA